MLVASRRYEDLWPYETEDSDARHMLMEPLWDSPLDVNHEDDGETLEEKWDNLIHEFVTQRDNDIITLTSILEFKVRGHVDDIVFSGENLLHIAARRGLANSVDILLKNSANEGSIDLRNGNTPLHCSAIGGHTACVQHLLLAGASPFIRNFSADKTPLHYASQYGYDKCIQIILTHCSTPDSAAQLTNMRDINGHTALHLACIDGNLDSVKLLLKHHVDGSIADDEGRTAYDIVSLIPGREAILRELSRHISEVPNTASSGIVARDCKSSLVSGGLFDGLNVAAASSSATAGKTLFGKPSQTLFPLFNGLHVNLPPYGSTPSPDAAAVEQLPADSFSLSEHDVIVPVPEGRWVAFQGKKFLLDRTNKKVIVHRDRHAAARYGQHWKWDQIDEEVYKSVEKTSLISKLKYKFKKDDPVVTNSAIASGRPQRRKSLLSIFRKPTFTDQQQEDLTPTDDTADTFPAAFAVTSTDDASDIFVAEIAADHWESFCRNIPHCLLEMDGEDPLLDAYIHKALKSGVLDAASGSGSNGRRPSFEGSQRRYSVSEEGSEVVQLTKDIAGLIEEIESMEAAIQCASAELSNILKTPIISTTDSISYPGNKDNKSTSQSKASHRPVLDVMAFERMLTTCSSNSDHTTNSGGNGRGSSADSATASKGGEVSRVAPLDATAFEQMLLSGSAVGHGAVVVAVVDKSVEVGSEGMNMERVIENGLTCEGEQRAVESELVSSYGAVEDCEVTNAPHKEGNTSGDYVAKVINASDHENEHSTPQSNQAARLAATVSEEEAETEAVGSSAAAATSSSSSSSAAAAAAAEGEAETEAILSSAAATTCEKEEEAEMDAVGWSVAAVSEEEAREGGSSAAVAEGEAEMEAIRSSAAAEEEAEWEAVGSSAAAAAAEEEEAREGGSSVAAVSEEEESETEAVGLSAAAVSEEEAEWEAVGSSAAAAAAAVSDEEEAEWEAVGSSAAAVAAAEDADDDNVEEAERAVAPVAIEVVEGTVL